MKFVKTLKVEANKIYKLFYCVAQACRLT